MQLHQHPDGRIFIRDPSGGYDATLADFASDNAAAFPTLPPGMAERIYEPSQRHVLADAKGNAQPQPMPWPPGDAIIAKLADLRIARAVREAPPPPPPPPTNAQLIDAEIASNVAFDALLIVLAGDKGKTKDQLIADMKLAKP